MAAEHDKIKDLRILWLASWYPNPWEPVNGDFIQRHAQAVANIIPLDVIHVVQLGKDGPGSSLQRDSRQGQLRERIYCFSFRKWGISWVDKIRYHWTYQKFYFRILRQYEQTQGIPSLLHVHVPLKAGLVARYFKKRWKIPYLVSEQASLYEAAARDGFDSRSLFYKYSTRVVFRGASLVTNVSATIGKELQRQFGLKEVRVVPNLADTQLFKPGLYPPESPVFRWIHVSSLAHQKNPEGIIEAFHWLFQKRKDWELIMVGPDPEPFRLQAKQLGISQFVSFTGELPYAAVAEQMQRAHAFVLFSRHENFPCVVVEALCCGLPVVASRVGGVPEAVRPANGMLVESEDINGLADALCAMMDQYRRFSLNDIAAEAKDNYSPDRIGREFFAIYCELIYPT